MYFRTIKPCELEIFKAQNILCYAFYVVGRILSPFKRSLISTQAALKPKSSTFVFLTNPFMDSLYSTRAEVLRVGYPYIK
jgi:hypothetical protein